MVVSDLHLHSSRSDGFWTPKELVLQAKLRGLKQIALTDHNTILGLAEAREEAKLAGIDFIDGVEINAACYFEGEFFQNHILAYNFDRSKLGVLLPKVIEIHNKLFEEIIENLRQLIEKKTFNSSVIKFRADVPAEINKYTILKDELRRVYLRDVTDEEIDELWKRKIYFPELIVRWMKHYIIEDADSYVKTEPRFWRNLMFANIPEVFDIIKSDKYFVSTQEVLREIHNAGGIAVIAHPFLDYSLYDEEKKVTYERLLQKLVADDALDGLELSFYVPKGFNEEVQEEFNRKAREFCFKNGLICTYGSDCHGPKRGDESKIHMGRYGSEEIQLKN